MKAFITSLSSVEIPKDKLEVLAIPKWKQDVLEKIRAPKNNGTWQLMDALRWVSLGVIEDHCGNFFRQGFGAWV